MIVALGGARGGATFLSQGKCPFYNTIIYHRLFTRKCKLCLRFKNLKRKKAVWKVQNLRTTYVFYKSVFYSFDKCLLFIVQLHCFFLQVMFTDF